LHHCKNKGLEVSKDIWRKVKVEKGKVVIHDGQGRKPVV
jgi:hypothetical protein